MRANSKNILYNNFHKFTSSQNKIISDKNFTYFLLVKVINKYIGKKKLILDIGCGAGTLCLYYAHKGENRVYGIDISQKAVDSANKSSQILGLSNVSFQQMDFPSVIPKLKFDLVIFTEVIEHLEDDGLALKKIFSLLNPGGIVIITTPSKNAPLYRIGYAKEFDKRVGHIRRYTLNELVNKCEQVGFSIVETKKTEGIVRNFFYLNPIAGKMIRFIKFFLVDLVTDIDWISMKLIGESNIFVIAQKP